MKLSKAFELNKRQPQLDFVDVDVSKDTRLFVDPYAIEIRDDDLSQLFAYHVVSYFQEILDALLAKNTHRAMALTENLHEPQETFLGFSQGRPQGRGVGRFQANQLLGALRNSTAFKTGLLTDIADTELFIEY